MSFQTTSDIYRHCILVSVTLCIYTNYINWTKINMITVNLLINYASMINTNTKY